MAFLELQNVGKSFGMGENRAEVLADIHLEIQQGEFVAIVGYSGSGKTTLMSLIAGLLQPDSGSIRLEGRDITSPGPERGLVFQNYSLLPWLTAEENVALAVDQVFPDRTPEQRRLHVEKYLTLVNLIPARNRRPHELSGGMRQRVSLARTLAMNPRILLLDEPLSALDALTRATLQDEIMKIWEADKKTVILITNDPDEGILLADRIIPLTHGPRATLGPSIPVALARPRHRTEIIHTSEFKKIRNTTIRYLLESAHQNRPSLTRNLVLPDIEPENLDINPPRLLSGRRTPIRRHELKKETVEIDG